MATNPSAHEKCRGCGANITWAKTERGKTIPLDMPAEMRFVLVSFFDRNDAPYQQAIMHKTYTSHFATCPKAAEFRRKEKE